ncbi:hypothetical protein [Flavobacterium sp. LAR06]|uniref:hypothetical protein n=1 Tax=Flavobacterium sp. LAR06 TaxID=3064897 RepID=UPI0035C11A5B
MKHYFHIDYKFTNTLDLKNNDAPNVEELFGEIFYNDYESDEPVKIGEVELHFYNYAFVHFGFNLYDAFDRSSNTIRLGDVLIDYKTDEIKPKIEKLVGESLNENILVIQEFILFPDHRGKGFGEEIISGIETFFKGKCGYITLQSFPKQHDISLKNSARFKILKLDEMQKDIKKAQTSLNYFYEKCGYIKIDNKLNCYIKNIEPMWT